VRRRISMTKLDLDFAFDSFGNSTPGPASDGSVLRFSERPTVASVSRLLTPKVSRNHPGVIVARPALAMDAALKMAIIA
jgi:hypothetical protein